MSKTLLPFDKIEKLKIYRYSDEANVLFRKKAARRIQQCRGELMFLLWDDAMTREKLKKLYKDMQKDAEKLLHDIAVRTYEDFVTDAQDEDDPADEWMDQHVLKTPHPITSYEWTAEIERKLARLIEAVSAVKTAKSKSDALLKYAKYFVTQFEYYSDIVTDEAILQAYKDCFVKKVKWVTVKDEKTCADCHERDGRIYKIEEIPVKPHPRCRCWIIPIDD